jgi:hypothetical protein
MAAYAVLRIKKLKSWGDIAGADAHNFRERETPNANEERTQDNVNFAGKADQDSIEAIRAAISEQKIRKNAVLAVEMLMSASPEYFRPGKESEAGSYDAGRARAWGETSAQWLRERYGDKVIKAVMHLDETTPHIHAVLVPLDKNGKLNCRALFGGSRHTLTELQTDYARAVEPLGIERGLQGSRAKHQEVAKFYAVTQGKEHAPVDRAKTVDIPQLPGKIERLSDDVLTRFARKVAASAITAQLAKVSPTLQALSGYKQEQYKQAVRDLAEAFGTDGAQRAVTRHISDTIPQQAKHITAQAAQEPIQLPQPCQETWHRARGYLTRERNLPEQLIDAAHSKGLIYSDQRGNCVFPCDQESGAFIRGTGTPFKRTMGQGHLPYSLNGSDNKIRFIRLKDTFDTKGGHEFQSFVTTNDFRKEAACPQVSYTMLSACKAMNTSISNSSAATFFSVSDPRRN